MTRRSTINDVATEAGVSVATVSRALRGLPNVSQGTRDRVFDAAASLNYTIDSRASSLASGRTGLVGLVAPLFGSWYTGAIVAGVETALAEAKLDLLVYSVDRPENRHDVLTERVGTRRIDGLILVDFFVEPGREDSLSSLNVPTVVIGEEIESCSSLAVDNIEGGRLAVAHLIDQGHSSIAYMGGAQRASYRSPVSANRRAGARNALVDAGLDPSSLIELDGQFTVEGGAAAFDVLRSQDSTPTAVFCASDEMAIGLMVAAWDAGLKVPDDLAIIGFDDHEMAVSLGLSTVRQSVPQLGSEAVNLLLRALDGEPKPKQVTIPLDVIARASSVRTS